MAKVTTWEIGDHGTLVNMINVRISHDLNLTQLIDGLCSKFARTNSAATDFPDTLTAKEILDIVREEYGYHGTSGIWTWVDQWGSEEDSEACSELARRLIIAAFPDMTKNRA